jgi:hypothetical protein
VIFQIGVAPLRIDILTTIDAVQFDAVGRMQDLADVEWLEKNRNK